MWPKTNVKQRFEWWSRARCRRRFPQISRVISRGITIGCNRYHWGQPSKGSTLCVYVYIYIYMYLYIRIHIHTYIYIPSASKTFFFWSWPKNQVLAEETRFSWNGKIASSKGSWILFICPLQTNRKQLHHRPTHTFSSRGSYMISFASFQTL